MLSKEKQKDLAEFLEQIGQQLSFDSGILDALKYTFKDDESLRAEILMLMWDIVVQQNLLKHYIDLLKDDKEV